MQLAESSTTGLSRIVYMVTFKNLVGKILAGLDKSAKSVKIFHHQNFALYGIVKLPIVFRHRVVELAKFSYADEHMVGTRGTYFCLI